MRSRGSRGQQAVINWLALMAAGAVCWWAVYELVAEFLRAVGVAGR